MSVSREASTTLSRTLSPVRGRVDRPPKAAVKVTFKNTHQVPSTERHAVPVREQVALWPRAGAGEASPERRRRHVARGKRVALSGGLLTTNPRSPTLAQPLTLPAPLRPHLQNGRVTAPTQRGGF